MNPVKATLLDDDAFRLLAVPFSGPIPSPRAPRGVDLDGHWFSERTDIKPGWLKARAVDWHHGKDPLGVMNPAAYADQAQPPERGRVTIGKAVDPVMDEEGWWVTVWLDAGQRRLGLIRQLAQRGAQLFGSSESIAGLPRFDKATGEILVWPYWRQTLSTSPQNTHSVLRPVKAVLDDIDYPSTTPAFWADLAPHLATLAADLRSASETGPATAYDHGLAKAAAEFASRTDAATAQAIEALRT